MTRLISFDNKESDRSETDVLESDEIAVSESDSEFDETVLWETDKVVVSESDWIDFSRHDEDVFMRLKNFFSRSVEILSYINWLLNVKKWLFTIYLRICKNTMLHEI